MSNEMLREGDVLTLALRPVIPSDNDYWPFKPEAVITRTLGEDPLRDRYEMECILVVSVCRELIRTVRARTRIQTVMGPECRVTALLEFCEEVVENGPDGIVPTKENSLEEALLEHFLVQGQEKESGRKAKKVRRKTGARKVRARKVRRKKED